MHRRDDHDSSDRMAVAFVLESKNWQQMPRQRHAGQRLRERTGVAMRIIELDASRCNTPFDFASALKMALGAPDWHGTKAVAFVDSMVAGGINTHKPPCVIKVVNTTDLEPEVMKFIREVSSFVEETRVRRLARTGENVAVRLEIAN
jgi:hypothetical protein